MGVIVPLLCMLSSQPGAAGAESSAPAVYVALGDSTAVGFGANQSYARRLAVRLHAERPGFSFRQLAENGATSRDVLVDQIPRLQQLKPTLVTVGVGVNDVTRQVT